MKQVSSWLPGLCLLAGLGYFSGCRPLSDKSRSGEELLRDSFPEGWLGVYKGTMEVYGEQGQKQEVPVRLDFLETDTVGRWVWRMTYQGKTPKQNIVKDYHWVHIEGNRYATDEGGGLLLDEAFIGKTFYGSYSMSNGQEPVMYSTIFKKTGKDELWFELFCVPLTPTDTVVGNIYNHRTSFVQKALFKRE